MVVYKDKSRLQGAEMYKQTSKFETGILLLGTHWANTKSSFPS